MTSMCVALVCMEAPAMVSDCLYVYLGPGWWQFDAEGESEGGGTDQSDGEEAANGEEELSGQLSAEEQRAARSQRAEKRGSMSVSVDKHGSHRRALH